MSKALAETILAQMGGNALRTFTGAKNFLSHNETDTTRGALSFRLPSNFAKDGINYIKVTLMPSDTYTMEFGKVWGHKYKVLRTFDDVYCDQLVEIFSRETGLVTPTVRFG